MTDKRSNFRLQQIYLTRASFGYRVPPLSLPIGTPHPPQKITVSITIEQLLDEKGADSGARQLVAEVRSTPEDPEDKALCDFTVVMGAVVDEINRDVFSDRQLGEALATMVFPFLRETVASITGRSRFGPVWINPYNIHKAFEEDWKDRTENADTKAG